MATAYICPMCVFNCDNLPDLEQHLEAHENNSIQSPIKQQQSNKSVRNSPLYAKSQTVLNRQQQKQNRSPINNSSIPLNTSPIRSSPNKTYDRRYSCKSCPFSTHSVKAYFNHRQMAHGEQLIITECPFCDYASQYPGKVKKHLTDEHPLQQMSTDQSPDQSNRTISHENSINNTIEQNGKINVEKMITRFTDCPFCSFTSIDSEAFRKHVLTNHLSDKNFRCLVCNRLYRYRGDCSFHIRKKHSDRMIGDNIESLREYIGEFQPNSMTAIELKELLSCPLTPSLASIPSNGIPINSRQSSTTLIQHQQPNPPHSFRCGYCKFSSVNSGDVKKHQTWKHANLTSNILPIDPNDPQQQPIVGYKRKRIHSTKTSNNEDDGPSIRRPRISMPLQRDLTINTSPSTIISTTNIDNDSAPRDLLSPNEPQSSSSFDGEQSIIKTNNNHLSTQHQLSAIGSLSSRVYKCIRCERLAPHRWIIERHIRAKHPSDLDNMSNIILEIDKPLTTSINGEPMTATKSSSATLLTSTSSSTDQDPLASTIPKAFSCSACSLQSYHLWVILRHIRNVHHNDGSNAKIIDNINNQIIEDNDDLESDTPVHSVSSNTMTTTITSNSNVNNNVHDNNEKTSEQNNLSNEEMLTRLINTAMTTRKLNATNTFFENLPTSLMNNNVAASLATLLGQLTNKQLIQQQQQQQQQQQFQAEKAPLVKRYKCSLCSHISAWGGNVKKHLKRMHPGDHSGHVIDLGLDLANTITQSPTDVSLTSSNDEVDEMNEQQIISTNINKIRSANENAQQSYKQPSEIINTKLKDIDNSPSFAPSSSTRPERLYGCSVCSYECTNPSNIHRHVELHSGDDGGGFQCSQCFFLSKWRASIRKHMISTHGSSLASLTNVLEPLILIKSNDATVIIKKWLIHENGIKHEDDPNNNNTHTMDTSTYYCSSCPYLNTNRLLFEQHVIHHNSPKTNENIYTCSFCTFNINEKDSFDKHQTLHIMKEDFQQDATANTLENSVI
ncbi:unnamed protein product [Rotaria sordida]|uniref:C2H2-type domain-containing protein n=1 Tax=Rotaria sordida TaxID=392033 RepID=A0A818S486_9BILA|nr:unnamed protein product [Rotaria sordida]